MIEVLEAIEAAHGWAAKRRYIRLLCEAHAEATEALTGRPVPDDDSDEDEPEGR